MWPSISIRPPISSTMRNNDTNNDDFPETDRLLVQIFLDKPAPVRPTIPTFSYKKNNRKHISYEIFQSMKLCLSQLINSNKKGSTCAFIWKLTLRSTLGRPGRYFISTLWIVKQYVYIYMLCNMSSYIKFDEALLGPGFGRWITAIWFAFCNKVMRLTMRLRPDSTWVYSSIRSTAFKLFSAIEAKRTAEFNWHFTHTKGYDLWFTMKVIWRAYDMDKPAIPGVSVLFYNNYRHPRTTNLRFGRNNKESWQKNHRAAKGF